MERSPAIGSKTFFYYWVPVILFCTLIFVQSSHPVPESLPRFPYVDKLLHVGAYALLSILFFRAYRTTPLGNRISAAMALSILSAGLYGISDELHQYFVPFRSADVLDALADFVGSALGALTAAAAAGKGRARGLTNPEALYKKTDRN